MANKPSIPKGTRDFSPEEMVRRNYIFDTIRSVFKKYGYQPIETPAMENIESLTGKYGDEGDQLLFKILNSRPYEAKDADKEKMRAAFDRSLKQNTNSADLTERALRYDLTVPFARYVVQHQHEITFPFKRYQIQPVWRADKPQKGRYREFFQCDADVIGSNSLLNEVEIVQMIDEVFSALKVPVTVKINNRKILSGVAEVIGAPDRMIDIAIAIDKVEKIGLEGVSGELRTKNFSEPQIGILRDLMSIKNKGIVPLGKPAVKHTYDLSLLNYLKNGSDYSKSEEVQKGVKEMEFLLSTIFEMGLKNSIIEFDVTLARGLNYYTGAIFEVKADVGSLSSSIAGGGRYDDLTGVFGLNGMSGVGISFGIDRIFDVLNEVGYPDDATKNEGTRLMFYNKGGQSEMLSLKLLKQVREKNIAAEIYPDNVKWEKQTKYVDAKNIPFTANVEEDGKITLKYKTGEKWNTEIVSFDELIDKIK